MVDTETTTDLTQVLTFGSSRICRVIDGVVPTAPDEPCGCGSSKPTRDCHREGPVYVVCVAEIIFCADDLPQTDPKGFATLKAYVSSHGAAIDPDPIGKRLRKDSRLHLFSRSQWVDLVWQTYVEKQGATVVGFNLPFDLSRLALRASLSRATGNSRDMAGGFTFTLDESGYRPKVQCKSLDSKKQLIQLTSNGDYKPRGNYRGSFLDCRTLGFALTNTAGNLLNMGKAFGARLLKSEAGGHGVITDSYIEYHRNDVGATACLLEAELREFYKHGLDLHPTRAFSPASIAKAYLEKMGVTPVLQRQPDFPKEVLGWTMSTFAGGRSEPHIRKQPKLSTLVDFTSMYASVDALLGIWHLLISKTITAEDCTPEVQRLLESVGRSRLGWLGKSSNWRKLVGIVQLVPDGDLLPVRARYAEDNWNIALNYLHGVTPTGEQVPMWYTLPDVVASVLLTGKVPTILKAYLFKGRGKLSTLRKIKFRGEVDIDPAKDDFFVKLVEARQALGKDKNGPLGMSLKTEANAGSYGINVELSRADNTDDTHKVPITIYGRGEPRKSSTYTPETPGRYFFPPIGACITGAARLMLATLEYQVTALGGEWMFCDTDSLAIVTGESEGALTPTQIEGIRGWYNQLSPYTEGIDLLKKEPLIEEDGKAPVYVGTCYVISAKRYCFYHVNEEGRAVIDKYSEHGLGQYRDPRVIEPITEDFGLPTIVYHSHKEWVAQVWQWVVETEVLHLDVPEPSFFEVLPVSALRISTPRMWHPFRKLNAGKLYRDQMKPNNFLFATATQNGKGRFVAPVSDDPSQWRYLPWVDLDGNSITHLANVGDAATERAKPSLLMVPSMRAVAHRFLAHPEAKFNGVDGKPCQARTTGVLQRKHIGVASLVSVGKESNLIEEEAFGLVDEEDCLVTYDDDELAHTDLRSVLAVVRHLSSAEIAARCGVTDRAIRMVRSGRAPGKKLHAALAVLAAKVVGARVTISGRIYRGQWQKVLQAASQVRAPTCAFPGCEEPPRKRSVWCSERHKKAGHRAVGLAGQPYNENMSGLMGQSSKKDRQPHASGKG